MNTKPSRATSSWVRRTPQPHAFKGWFGGGASQPHCACCGQLRKAAIHALAPQAPVTGSVA